MIVFLVLFSGCRSHVSKEPIDYVDPFIGTSVSRWMLFPGPALPFGMVKLSPNNVDDWGFNAGYEDSIKSICGFGHVHSWMMNSFLMMPTTGDLQIRPGRHDNPDGGYRSRISPGNAIATIGYYSVELDDYNIKAELTATTRCGFQRYTFPESDASRIIIDLHVPEEARRPEIMHACIRKVSDTEISGHVHRTDRWNNYTIHFVTRFSKPISSMGGWKGDDIHQDIDSIYIDINNDIGAFFNFHTSDNEVIMVKTGISYVSTDQARLNLETELDQYGWDFDAVHQNARDTWNDLLGKIKVKGGSETDKVKFYTNLYRSYCARTIFSDVNGKYIDACDNIKQLPDPQSPVYGCDAFWMTFWNLNQLWSLVNPDIASKWAKSQLQLYDDGGWLNRGPGGLKYSGIMTGEHEIPLISNAYLKGIRDFDIEKAYKAMKEIQTTPGQPHPCGGYAGNRDLPAYMRMGYVPSESGRVSNTLDYAFNDWNVAQLAKALGKEEDYYYFMKRSQNYRNVFDPSTGYIRPKEEGGPWVDFNPTLSAVGKEDAFPTRHYVEGNAWQFTWFVPHDLKGLIGLMGREEFNQRLDEGFKKSLPNFTSNFVNHSNQPNMQAAWLFNYSGKPWLTQKWVREILDNYYGTGPLDGYPGDEDQGQMGAWYVMSAMGLFQMDGGTGINPAYEIASPLFEKITIRLDPVYYPGKEFVIHSKNFSPENRYIQSATLNGKSLNKFWFSHAELVRGGKLVLEMGPEPNRQWAVDSDHPQVNEQEIFVTTPYIAGTEKIFAGQTTVTLVCDTKEASIHYTLDGQEPDRNSPVYTKPLDIGETTTIKMIAYAGNQESLPSTAELIKAP